MRYFLAIALLLSTSAPLSATDDLGPQISSKKELTPDERAEKSARRTCKIEICDIIATREAVGPNIACDVGWSWRAEEIVEALGGRVDWTWGKAVCETELRLERAALADAMSAPRASIEIGAHTVRCALHDDGMSHKIEIELAPRIALKNGKAIEAQVNWGDVSAPAVIYPLLYAATGLDNSTNLLGSEVVHQVNNFVRKDCAEVKDDLPGRRVN